MKVSLANFSAEQNRTLLLLLLLTREDVQVGEEKQLSRIPSSAGAAFQLAVKCCLLCQKLFNVPAEVKSCVEIHRNNPARVARRPTAHLTAPTAGTRHTHAFNLGSVGNVAFGKFMPCSCGMCKQSNQIVHFTSSPQELCNCAFLL